MGKIIINSLILIGTVLTFCLMIYLLFKLKKKLNSHNMFIFIPINHKLIQKREVVEVINPVLFKFKDVKKIGKNKEYLVQLAFVENYDMQNKRNIARQKKVNLEKILIEENTQVYSKCVSAKYMLIGNRKEKVEFHIVYYMKKNTFNLIDYLLQGIRQGLFEAKETNALNVGYSYYKETLKYKGGK